MKRVIRYEIRSKKIRTFYGRKGGSLILEVYVDVDWVGDAEIRNSVSGYFVMMRGSAVSWSARQQKVVALSLTES